jgi:hypothetical protein
MTTVQAVILTTCVLLSLCRATVSPPGHIPDIPNVSFSKRIVRRSAQTLLFLLFRVRVVVSLFLHDCFTIPGEVLLERVDILVKTECAHSPQYIIAVDRFALLSLALVAGLGRNEADKLAHAFLNRVLSVLCDLGVVWQGLCSDRAAHAGRKMKTNGGQKLSNRQKKRGGNTR